MDVEHLAESLDRSVRTVWDWVQKGKLPRPGVYISRRAYWLPEQLDEVDTP